VAIWFLLFSLIASDWPEWRGPHRDGVVLEEPKAWPEKLNLKWKIEVGIGHSSPVMAAGSIYDFAREGDQETVLSIDPANGKVRWKQQYAAPYKMNPAAVSHGEGPKATPLYADGKLYTFGISGILSAFDAETGKPLWRLDTKGSPDFGTAMSPVFDGGMVIAHVGGTKVGALTAFDPANGAVKWTWNGDSPAYASPLVVELGGVRQVVTQSHSNIVGIAAASGKLLWKIPFSTEYDQNIVTPVLYKDTLIFSGIDKGVFAVRLESHRRRMVDADRLAEQGRFDVYEFAGARRRFAFRLFAFEEGSDFLSGRAHGDDSLDRAAAQWRQRRDARELDDALRTDSGRATADRKTDRERAE
jgi:outer membrane protein assembly factor BamB